MGFSSCGQRYVHNMLEKINYQVLLFIYAAKDCI